MAERQSGAPRIQIRTAAKDADGSALHDLYRWLQQDPAVRDHADIRLAYEPAPRPVPPTEEPAERDIDGSEADTHAAAGANFIEQEVALDVVDIIDLVLTQGFSALNLALAYAAWRAARRSAPSITITAPDGRSITVQGASDDTLLRIVEALDPAAAESPTTTPALEPESTPSAPEDF